MMIIPAFKSRTMEETEIHSIITYDIIDYLNDQPQTPSLKASFGRELYDSISITYKDWSCSFWIEITNESVSLGSLSFNSKSFLLSDPKYREKIYIWIVRCMTKSWQK